MQFTLASDIYFFNYCVWAKNLFLSVSNFIHCHFAFSVFISLQKRQFEQIKEVVPIILNVLKTMSLETDDAEVEGVFGCAVEIANSVYAVFSKMVCEFNVSFSL